MATQIDLNRPITDSFDGSGRQVVQNGQVIAPGVSINDITTQSRIDLPVLSPDDTNYSGILKEGSAISKYAQNVQEPKSLEAAYSNAYNSSNLDALNKQANTDQVEVGLLNAQLQGINDSAQVAQQTLSSQARGRNATTDFLSGQQQEISRQAAIKSLPLQAQVLAAQARMTGSQNAVKLAQDKLNQLFDIKSKDIENKYNYHKDLNSKIYDYATNAEKRVLDREDKKKENEVQLERDLNTYKQSLVKQLVESGQGSLISELTGAKTMDEVSSIASRISLPASTKAPEIKTINGVEKQWNPVTRTWDEISGGGTSPEQTQKSLDQFAFLGDTIEGAMKLSDAAGPNMITKGVGNFFVGNTRVKQLAQKLDSLKVNLLTLNTDPAVKKFFGPQMTERDTQLMTSAGTTMDAYSNSQDDLIAELTRYNDLINRMRIAVQLGASGKTNIITSPTGERIQIID